MGYSIYSEDHGATGYPCGEQDAEIARLRAALRQAREACEKALDALIWCSGSYDFTPEGKAGKGWKKLGKPAIDILFAALDATKED